MSTFDSTKVALPDMIRDIITGKVQLPDFQRGWVWDDSHVRSLLVSVARSFPVGAVMLLDTGGEVRFQVRPIENVDFPKGIPEPEKLILDGQQRLTSLTQVLALNKPVKTFDEKGKRIDRYYYIDIQKALEVEQLEDAIIAVEQSRQLKTNFGRDVALDLSNIKLECEQLFFPCNQILNSDAWEESLQEFAPQHFGTYMLFRRHVLNAFRSYQLPVIALGKTTSKEAVCLVFEKVNTGGVPLSVFELITATFAADNFNLRDDWYGSELRKVPGRRSRLLKEHLLMSIEPTDFLQAVSLLNSYERRQADIAAGKAGKFAAAVSAKRSALLSLKLVEYERWADTVEQGFKRAAQFLRKECFFTVRDLPYRTQIVPLAAVLAMLEERWLEPRIHDKLSQWFWCGVFGELYGGAVETRIANDLEDLLAWIGGKGETPRTVYEAAFQSNRLLTLRSRLSAAYKGLNVLVQREGARDFFWKARIQELDLEEIALDIHHIFPKAWCDANGIKPATYNSVINKTAISYKANRMIGGKAPSSYLKSVQEHAQVQMGDDAMNDILESHFISPQSLREDDFEQFFALRQQSLLAIVAQAMGKQADMTIAMSDGNEEDTDNEDFEVAE
ncbi:GmrSD restriction endonuclease domain-containing protein [Aeromonas sp. 11P]|uniref:GmrSD restriction endonuclease domain-containing protein n=1 Tax=Aeromonas sp. 11P TaxID=3452713 RepID=UPI003F7A0FAD